MRKQPGIKTISWALDDGSGSVISVQDIWEAADWTMAHKAEAIADRLAHNVRITLKHKYEADNPDTGV